MFTLEEALDVQKSGQEKPKGPKLYEGYVIAVNQGGDMFIIESPEGVPEWLCDVINEIGGILEPTDIHGLPSEPGAYVCDLEYVHVNGYFEGYRAPGEDSWYLDAHNIRKMTLSEQPVP